MSKNLKTVFAALVVLAIVAALVYPKLELGAKTEGKKERKGPPPTPVNVQVASTSRLADIINTTGTVLPNEEVTLQAEVSGRVTSINFREGERVKKGQVLVTINSDELRAQMNRVEATRALRNQEEGRQSQLLAREAISQQEYDIAQTGLQTATAEIDELKAQIRKYTIIAPFDGEIGLRSISSGSYISPTTPIAYLVDADPVKIDFDVPGRYANEVKKGDSIAFVMEGVDEAFGGVIYAINPIIDPETRSLQVRAIAPNPSGKIMPGAFVNVKIVLSSSDEAIMVPTEAVIPDRQGHKLYVMENGFAKEIGIEIGSRQEKRIEVKTGISAGDTVITSGVMGVRDGSQVSIKAFREN